MLVIPAKDESVSEKGLFYSLALRRIVDICRDRTRAKTIPTPMQTSSSKLTVACPTSWCAGCSFGQCSIRAKLPAKVVTSAMQLQECLLYEVRQLILAGAKAPQHALEDGRIACKEFAKTRGISRAVGKHELFVTLHESSLYPNSELRPRTPSQPRRKASFVAKRLRRTKRAAPAQQNRALTVTRRRIEHTQHWHR